MRRLSLRSNKDLAAHLDGFLIGLPELSGSPIRIEAFPQLTASRGRLLSGTPHCGIAVYAASFIPSRRIVIEASLLRRRTLFRFILIHEVFHFVWARLGNAKRAEFSGLLEQEFAAGARGELGESSQTKKTAGPVPQTRAWRDYVCESFCDTAAFVYLGLNRNLAPGLAKRWKDRRRQWFEITFAAGCRC